MENICLRISIANPRGNLKVSAPVGAVLDAWPLTQFATWDEATDFVTLLRENRGQSGLLFITGCPDGFLEFAKEELRMPLQEWKGEERGFELIRPHKWYADTSLVTAEEVVAIQNSKFLKITYSQALTVLIEREPIDDDVRNDSVKHTLGESGLWQS